MNPIIIAIPVFFVLIGLEQLLAMRHGRQVYRFTDALTDISCGIGDQATGIFIGLIKLGAYTAVYTWLRVWELEGVLEWVVAFFMYDFAYYWWHRFTHEVNIGWATHVVHHQSEDYNLAVALRQSATGTFTSTPFYLPMAVLGIDPVVFAATGAISLLYQFWIHTELVGKLGPIEWVFNTPSHHRVHHATNPQYLDRNHAAVLIVWDRLFGTFEVEDEEPVYGTVKPLASYDPLWAQVWYLKLLADDWRAAEQPGDRWRVLFSEPGFRPANLEPYPEPGPVSRGSQRKYDPPTTVALRAYLAVQFMPVAFGLLWLLWAENTAPLLHLVAGMLALLWGTWSWSRLIERRRNAVAMELLRLGGSVVLVIALASSPSMIVAALALGLLSVGWVLALTPQVLRTA